MDDPFIGKVLAGKYRIDGFLKKGGMGAVYRGTHLMLGKSVAIKVIKPELVTSDDTVQRFQREARAASHLSHPNIVTIHDLDQAEGGTLYIAMELLDGKSLKQVVMEQGALEPDRAIRIAKAIAGALALAHRNNVIHRDLKPQNIMMTRDSNGGEKPILLDFGIAKTFESDQPAITSTGMVLGTPQYMAPEQAAGKPVDGRSDLYALGIILYEMLVGQVPFDDPSIPAVLVKHLNELPKPPSTLRSGIPPSLEQIVLRCLDKVPEKRFASAEELLAALSAVEETVVAPKSNPTVGIPALIPPIGDEPTQVQKTSISAVPSPPLPPPLPNVPLDEVTVRSDRKLHSQKASNRGLWMAMALCLVGIVAVAVALIVLTGGKDDPPSVGAEATPGAALVASPVAIPAEPTAGSEDVPPDNPQLQEAAVTPPTLEAEEPGEEPARVVPPTPRAPRESAATAAVTPPTTTSPPEPIEQPTTPIETPIPAQPSVDLDCQGVSDACASLRAALEASFDRAGMSLAYPERAEILVTIVAEEVEARQESQFGTLFVVRTYSIEIAGESPRFGERVSMPPPEMVTFDSRFGADKLAEHSRKVAGAVTKKILAYWSRKK